MKIAYVVRKDCPRCVNILERIDRILPNDWERVYENGLEGYVNAPEFVDIRDIEADILFIIGGDGTVLRAAQYARGAMMGINMGSLGFLSEVELGKVEDTIFRIVRGEYKFAELMRLEISVNGKMVGYALNEAVIHSDAISKVRNFKLNIDGKFVERTRADGVIVATPVGSTSYSLSAGGPIVMPETRAMVVSYLAPVTLRIRPMVMPSSSVLSINVVGKDNSSVIILDGQREIKVRDGDTVTITGSSKPYRFITFKRDFYTKLREKLLKDVVN
ncbi:MAG: NAD(+) kinase [Candidatus Thermoplasmatota archaeon]|jgi:NAD+ kinase|nr:NAD(+) kinase [Candidatus Thermoplasmatota archaeon]MCL5987940.1 NAD(+) kinase [Candidatus Thermoplasmatota archaeon]